MRLLLRLSLLVFFVSHISSAQEQWQHDDLITLVNNVVVEQVEETKPLLMRLDRYLLYAQQKSWLDIEIIVMSKKASFYSMLQQYGQAKQIIDKYLPIAEKNQETTSVLTYLSVLLQYYDNETDQNNAINTRLRYENTAILSGNKKEIAQMNTDLAHSKQLFGDLPSSLSHLQKALAITENIKDLKGKGVVLNSLAILYDEMEKYEQAIEYYNKAISIYALEGKSFSLSVLYFNLGQSYFSIKKLVLAEEMINIALEMSRSLNDEVGEGYALHYLGKVAFERLDFDKAKNFYIAARHIFEKNNIHRMFFRTTLSVADVLGKLDFPEQGLAYLSTLETKLETLKHPASMVEYYTKTYQLKKKQGDYFASLTALERVAQEKQMIYEKEKEDSFHELMIKFDSSQKASENKLLQQQNQLKELRIAEQEAQKFIYTLILGIALIGSILISFFLYKQIQNRNRFKHMAMRDELTGAPSRRAILTIGNRNLRQSIKHKTPLIVAILDIDKFKNFNDTYGHDVGDKVLRVFSEACKEGLRKNDHYGRYGGEEWLLILPDAQKYHIEVIFTRLKEQLENISLEGGPSDISLTFSLGATERISSDSGLNSMIKRADQNLYQAKNNGRDNFVIG